jgi:hypothetical protein
MEKVVRLINILDDNTVDKLVILDRLVKLHVRFLTKWRIAEVTSNGAIVRVKFSYVDKYDRENWTEREFPMEDIDKRIISYKRKIKKEFGERHENLRLLRERDIYRWELMIKNLRTNADI